MIVLNLYLIICIIIINILIIVIATTINNLTLKITKLEASDKIKELRLNTIDQKAARLSLINETFDEAKRNKINAENYANLLIKLGIAGSREGLGLMKISTIEEYLKNRLKKIEANEKLLNKLKK